LYRELATMTPPKIKHATMSQPAIFDQPPGRDVAIVAQPGPHKQRGTTR
jgi:hypothetical protein